MMENATLIIWDGAIILVLAIGIIIGMSIAQNKSLKRFKQLIEARKKEIDRLAPVTNDKSLNYAKANMNGLLKDLGG